MQIEASSLTSKTFKTKQVKIAPNYVPIIIDIGSYQCKAGFANEKDPNRKNSFNHQ